MGRGPTRGVGGGPPLSIATKARFVTLHWKSSMRFMSQIQWIHRKPWKIRQLSELWNSVINTVKSYLLTSPCFWLGPSGMLCVVYQLPSVPVSVLWARLEKSYNLKLDVRNILAGSHTEHLWRWSLLITLWRKFYIFCSLSSVLLVQFNPFCFGMLLDIPFILQEMWKESFHRNISLLLDTLRSFI